jgi:excisionase family DNA binding protein
MTQPTVSATPTRVRLTQLWTVDDVSDYLGVPVKTLYRWRCTGYGPIGRKVGKHVRYKPADVETWFDQLTDPAA